MQKKTKVNVEVSSDVSAVMPEDSNRDSSKVVGRFWSEMSRRQ